MKQVYVVYDAKGPIAVFNDHGEAHDYADNVCVPLYVDAAPLNPEIDDDC